MLLLIGRHSIKKKSFCPICSIRQCCHALDFCLVHPRSWAQLQLALPIRRYWAKYNKFSDYTLKIRGSSVSLKSKLVLQNSNIYFFLNFVIISVIFCLFYLMIVSILILVRHIDRKSLKCLKFLVSLTWRDQKWKSQI